MSQDLVGRAHLHSSSMVPFWSCSYVSRGCDLGKVLLGWPTQWLTLVNGEWLMLAVVSWALCWVDGWRSCLWWWLQVGGLLVRPLTPTPGAEAASSLLTFSDNLFCQGSHKPFRFRGLGTGMSGQVILDEQANGNYLHKTRFCVYTKELELFTGSVLKALFLISI